MKFGDGQRSGNEKRTIQAEVALCQLRLLKIDRMNR